MLAGTGLTPDYLLKTELPVSLEITQLMMGNASRILGAGWHLSLEQVLSISTHGPLGFASVTAPDLRAPIDVLLRFIGIRAPFVWLTGLAIKILQTLAGHFAAGSMCHPAVIEGLVKRGRAMQTFPAPGCWSDTYGSGAPGSFSIDAW